MTKRLVCKKKKTIQKLSCRESIILSISKAESLMTLMINIMVIARMLTSEHIHVLGFSKLLSKLMMKSVTKGTVTVV